MAEKRTPVNNSTETEIDLVEVFRLLKSRIWTLLIAIVLAAGLAGGYTAFFVTPKYQSTSQIFILNTSDDLSISELQIGSQLTQDYMEIIKSRPVLETTIEELKLDMGYAELGSMLTITNPQNTRILYLTITNTDAYMAKTIVDKLTDVSIEFIHKKMDTEKPNVIDYGHIAGSPSSPSMKRNVIIGGLLGFVLAAAVIIIRYLMNDSIHTSEDVEKYIGINTIGMIPFDGTGSKKKTHGRDKTGKNAKKSGKINSSNSGSVKLIGKDKKNN